MGSYSLIQLELVQRLQFGVHIPVRDRVSVSGMFRLKLAVVDCWDWKA